MGHVVSLFGMVAFLVAGGWQLVRAVDVFREAGERVHRLWIAEYQVRRCAEGRAVALNLRDAARWVVEQRAALRPAVMAIEEELREGLAARLVVGGDAVDEHCTREDLPGIEAALHREEGEGRSRNWPNWVVRLVRAS